MPHLQPLRAGLGFLRRSSINIAHLLWNSSPLSTFILYDVPDRDSDKAAAERSG